MAIHPAPMAIRTIACPDKHNRLQKTKFSNLAGGCGQLHYISKRKVMYKLNLECSGITIINFTHAIGLKNNII